MRKVELDENELATVLAALRLFQREYEGRDAVEIADNWPMHFNVQGDRDELIVTPTPLGTEDIDALCERINCGEEATTDMAKIKAARQKAAVSYEDQLRYEIDFGKSGKKK